MTMKNFWDIISFVSVTLLLEPVRPLVTILYGKLAEVYFEFKRIEEIVHIYEETRENADERFQLVYAEVNTLTRKLGSEEK